MRLRTRTSAPLLRRKLTVFEEVQACNAQTPSAVFAATLMMLSSEVRISSISLSLFSNEAFRSFSAFRCRATLQSSSWSSWSSSFSYSSSNIASCKILSDALIEITAVASPRAAGASIVVVVVSRTPTVVADMILLRRRFRLSLFF